MSAKDDGGPAFPTLTELDGQRNAHNVVDYTAIYQIGMSLRDYFAGQALSAMTAGYLVMDDMRGTESEVATRCYELADAMLKERSKP